MKLTVLLALQLCLVAATAATTTTTTTNKRVLNKQQLLDRAIPANSRLGQRILEEQEQQQQQRNYNSNVNVNYVDNSNGESQVNVNVNSYKPNLRSSHSVRFYKCLSLSVQPNDGDDNANGGDNNAYLTSQVSYVLFKLCTNGNCNLSTESDLYIVSLQDYLDAWLEYVPYQREQYCQVCENRQDYCQNLHNNKVKTLQERYQYQQQLYQQQREYEQMQYEQEYEYYMNSAVDASSSYYGYDAQGYDEGDFYDYNNNYNNNQQQQEQQENAYAQEEYGNRNLRFNVKCSACEAYGCFDYSASVDRYGNEYEALDIEEVTEWISEKGQCAQVEGSEYYTSFMCNAKGNGVELALFTDEDCTTYTSEVSLASVVLQNNNNNDENNDEQQQQQQQYNNANNGGNGDYYDNNNNNGNVNQAYNYNNVNNVDYNNEANSEWLQYLSASELIVTYPFLHPLSCAMPEDRVYDEDGTFVSRTNEYCASIYQDSARSISRCNDVNIANNYNSNDDDMYRETTDEDYYSGGLSYDLVQDDTESLFTVCRVVAGFHGKYPNHAVYNADMSGENFDYSDSQFYENYSKFANLDGAAGIWSSDKAKTLGTAGLVLAGLVALTAVVALLLSQRDRADQGSVFRRRKLRESVDGSFTLMNDSSATSSPKSLLAAATSKSSGGVGNASGTLS